MFPRILWFLFLFDVQTYMAQNSYGRYKSRALTSSTSEKVPSLSEQGDIFYLVNQCNLIKIGLFNVLNCNYICL